MQEVSKLLYQTETQLKRSPCQFILPAPLLCSLFTYLQYSAYWVNSLDTSKAALQLSICDWCCAKGKPLLLMSCICPETCSSSEDEYWEAISRALGILSSDRRAGRYGQLAPHTASSQALHVFHPSWLLFRWKVPSLSSLPSVALHNPWFISNCKCGQTLSPKSSGIVCWIIC